MRTTINIDEQLLAELKTAAAQSGRTLTAVIEDALREATRRRRERADSGAVELPVHRGGGPQPGVDLDDTSALMDRMDGRPG